MTPEATNLAWMYFFTFLGAATLYILNRNGDRHPFSVYRAINISIGQDAKPYTVLCDILFSAALGALIIVNLTDPKTVPQAIVAGLGMTGLLSCYATNTGGSTKRRSNRERQTARAST